MSTSRKDILRFALLLLVSLLLHLTLIISLMSGCRPKAGSCQETPHLIVESLAAVHSLKALRPATPAPKSGETAIDGRKAGPHPKTGLKPAEAEQRTVGSSVRESTGQPPGEASLPAGTVKNAETVSLAATDAKPDEGGTQAGSSSVKGRVGGTGTAEAKGSGSNVPATTGAALQRRGAYRALLKSLIDEQKRYPPASRRAGREGSCQRRFVLDRGGRLKQVDALSSCGHGYLDEAATHAITSIGSFPPLPQEFSGNEEAFTITITFTLAGK